MTTKNTSNAVPDSAPTEAPDIPAISREAQSTPSLPFLTWLDRQSPTALGTLLVLASLALNIFRLGTMQFFRHTEADRTLIAWEMLQRSDFLVPHLLDAPILTKPPLFYWMIAASMTFFGDISEWAARIPSVLAASFLVLAQFRCVLSATGDKRFALLSAVILGTGAHFLTLATVAEIDMMFAFFCALTIYSVYFFVERPTLLRAILGALAATLAFLTKGPPVIVFSGIALTGTFVYFYRQQKGTYPLVRFLSFGILATAIFTALVGAWLVTLAERVGAQELVRQWDIEIFQRFFHGSTHSRGSHFYLGSVILGLLPWSFFFVAALPLFSRDIRQSLKLDPFLAFNLVTSVACFILLSAAEGKSSRYLFPLYPFLANLLAWLIFRIPQLRLETLSYRFALIFGSIGTIVALITPVVLKPEGVSLPELIISSALLFIAMAGIALFGHRRQAPLILASLAFTMVAVRAIDKMIYVPYRNATRSVHELAHTIALRVPPKETLYTIELFERWIVFTLKQQGRTTTRLTPSLISTMDLDRELYLLISYDDEWWRLPQLRAASARTTLIADLKGGADRIFILRLPVRALAAANLTEDYPTTPTPPPPEYLLTTLGSPPP